MKPIGLRLAGGGLIAFALAAGWPAPVAAQTLVCTTTTRTTTWYFPDGSYVSHKEEVTYCRPIEQT